jgi:hypothetical protein
MITSSLAVESLKLQLMVIRRLQKNHPLVHGRTLQGETMKKRKTAHGPMNGLNACRHSVHEEKWKKRPAKVCLMRLL